MSQSIVVVDYGMGNIGSILNRFELMDIEATVSSKREDIDNADRIILPGVGYFANGMRNLADKKLLDVLNDNVIRNKKPILGICLGMQLLTKWSEEGEVAGLGWIDAKTKAIRFQNGERNLRIPHMGWNSLRILKESPLFTGLPSDALFYFVHSFHVDCNNEDNRIATTSYGIDLTAAIQQENIFGTQFHPEKSHEFGSIILKNFAEYK